MLVAIPFHGYAGLPASVFAGRVVIDANNYYGGRDGANGALENDETTSSEPLAAHLAGAPFFNRPLLLPDAERELAALRG